MSIFKKWFGKPEKRECVDLSKLEDNFILYVGESHCDTCSKETINCCKIDLGSQSVCICPRKDIKGFYKPKSAKK